MYKTLEFSIRDQVARVRFTTPDSLNSISEDRIADLQAVVRAVRCASPDRDAHFVSDWILIR